CAFFFTRISPTCAIRNSRTPWKSGGSSRRSPKPIFRFSPCSRSARNAGRAAESRFRSPRRSSRCSRTRSFASATPFASAAFSSSPSGNSPGVESVLAEFGIRFFVVDTHGILHACPRPLPGTYAPFRTEARVLALGRDADSSRQVWSATEGYPGDASYREYYRDQGFDLPMEEVREFLPSGGTRTHLGLKYYRIT